MRRLPSARGTFAASATAFAILGLPRPAIAAEPTVQECLAASDQAISLRKQHALIAARTALLVCASAACPEEVRDDCTRRVEEINSDIPTVVFEAKDGGGNDVTAVKVTVDGHPFAAELQGAATPIDPGRHTFVFETAGQPRVTKQILIVEGVRDRHEVITLGTPTPSKAASTTEKSPSDMGSRGSNGTTQRILGWTAVGAGVLGLGVGLLFELERSSKQSDADSICPSGTCPPGVDPLSSNAQIQNLNDDARTDGTVAAVAFVAGGVLVAGGLALVLTAPAGGSDVAVAPLIAPGVQGLGAAGRF